MPSAWIVVAALLLAACGASPVTGPPTGPTEQRAPTAALQPRVHENVDRNGDGTVDCADFSTQAQAKAALDAGYAKLDDNRDGVACESLPAE